MELEGGLAVLAAGRSALSFHSPCWCSVQDRCYKIHALVGGLVWAFAVAGDLYAEVAVVTESGRVISGEIDERTTERHLWLRHDEARIVMASPVRWSAISTARLDGEAMDVSAIKQVWPHLMSSVPGGFLSQSELAEAPSQGATPLQSIPSPAGELARMHDGRRAGRVRSIEIGAFLVQLDRDVEPDGLELYVSAVDSFGRAVPVRGNLVARLVGQQNELYTPRVSFDDLQRWSEAVRPADFRDGSACYTLRFRNVRPEFDWELMPCALLNVRLGVYGQGNFEATVPVAIREFNPMRDELQQYRDSRFLRNELSGEPRH